MSKLDKLDIIMGAYVLIGIITFGHSAAHFRPDPKHPEMTDIAQPTKAGLAAMLWPLYWAWEAQTNG